MSIKISKKYQNILDSDTDSFVASRNGQKETFTHEESGYTIDIYQDTCAENPWEAWDGMTPLLVLPDRRFEPMQQYGTPYDLSDLVFLARKSEYDVQRALLALAESHFDWVTDTIDSLASESDMDKESYLSDSALEAFDESIGQFDNQLDSESIPFFLEALDLLNVPYTDYRAIGYSQGDSAQLIAIATSDYLAQIGLDPESDKDAIESDLESSCKLWESWAYGDVYGYVINDSQGETLESCFGYYGLPSESDIYDDSLFELARILTKEEAKRVERLKELIKARVPFRLRESALSNIVGS